jgi:tetratricopeptide (TPR) repeat protein
MDISVDTYYRRASHLTEVGRWREAIKEAVMCLAIEPSHYNALCTISRSYYELGEMEKALEFAGKAIAADPTQEWAYRLQSAVYSKKNKKKKRLETALEAIKQEPESTLALQNLTFAQLSGKKFKEARQTAEKLRSLAPDSAESHRTMGYVEYNDYQFAAAEEHFRSALKIEATDYDSLNMLGETLMKRYEGTGSFAIKKQLLNEAIDCFRQAIVLSPAMDDAKKNLREAHVKSIASTPVFLVPLAYSVLLLILLFANRKSNDPFRPELLDLADKPFEVAALYWICGLSSMLTFYWVAAVVAARGISELNRKMIDLVENPTRTAVFCGKFVFGFWLLISAYPLCLVIWKLVTLNFSLFSALNILDWTMLLLHLIAFGLNCFLMRPYILEQKTEQR